MSSSISRVTLSSLESQCKNAIRDSSEIKFCMSSHWHVLFWRMHWNTGSGSLEKVWEGVELYIKQCYLIMLKYGHIVKRGFQNIYIWKVLWRRKKDISPPLRCQLHHIHLVHCHVNVPANSAPLCRRSRQETLILLWMDRITYSRQLCFRLWGRSNIKLL